MRVIVILVAAVSTQMEMMMKTSKTTQVVMEVICNLLIPNIKKLLLDFIRESPKFLTNIELLFLISIIL